jgi:KaiC/GvpD/RAD55 family RecA-like ATPase
MERMMKGSILDTLKALTLNDIQEIGLGKGRGRGTWGPCPFCSATRRGSTDGRAPLGSSNGKGVKCHVCSETADVADIVAQKLMGKRIREFDSSDWRAFEVACLRYGWKPADTGHQPSGNFQNTKKVKSIGKVIEKMIGPDPVKKELKPDIVESVPEKIPSNDFPWHPELVDKWHADLYSDAGANALSYLKSVRGFTDETIKRWKLGFYGLDRGGKIYEEFVSIPMMNEHKRPVNFRFRSVPGQCRYCEGSGCSNCKNKGEVLKKYRPCTGRPLVLFGAHTLGADVSESVLVLEGELDVIAASQYGQTVNVVSSTAGATTFKEEWLDLIEPYRSFTLALDDDKAGNEGAESLADKLGRYRCSRALFEYNDIGACLERGVEKSDITRAISRAKSMLNSEFKTADEFSDELEQLISEPDKLKGLTTGSAKLDKMIGGWRPGLVVVTADTGSGKTTFMTWAMYQQAVRGVPVAITSFENRPISAVQKLLRQHIGGDFTGLHKEQRREALNEIGELPLYILDHAGHMKFSDVVETVRYSVRRHGTRMILIDHLGFLISNDADDERREIEHVVRSLSLLAYNEGVTIVLIAHPSNQNIAQRRRVMMSDLKGASSIRQDASMVLVLERGTVNKDIQFAHTKVHADKIRSEFGLAGTNVNLAFDPDSVTYADDPGFLPNNERRG